MAQRENRGALEWISGTLGKVAATQDNHTGRLDKLAATQDKHTARLDKLDTDVQGIKKDIAVLRQDLPSMMAETMREVLREKR
jgi:hypothetical protein